jgi:hypothetical protein
MREDRQERLRAIMADVSHELAPFTGLEVGDRVTALRMMTFELAKALDLHGQDRLLAFAPVVGVAAAEVAVMDTVRQGIAPDPNSSSVRNELMWAFDVFEQWAREHAQMSLEGRYETESRG